MSDTGAQTFNVAMQAIQTWLISNVPGLEIVLNIPVVGGWISGFAGSFSNALRDMFGAYPDPPDLPAGYHYESFPIITDTYVTFSNAEYQQYIDPTWTPDPEMYQTSQPVWIDGIVVIGGDIVIDDATGIPVADYNHKKGTMKGIKGFTSDGIPIVGGSTASLQAIGQPSTGRVSRYEIIPNLWKAGGNSSRFNGKYAIYSSDTREEATAKAQAVAEQLTPKPILAYILIALVVIITVAIIVRKAKK